MEVTRQDLTRCETLVKTLNRAEVKTEGALEALALAQVITWVGALKDRISAEVTSMEDTSMREHAEAIQEYEKKKASEEKRKAERLERALKLMDDMESPKKLRKVK
jgi:hypothetical protein